MYIETLSTTTNRNGLATIQIGAGFSTLDSFSSINWANRPYFAKIETDQSGGTNYTLTTVSQLLSIPYAPYALKSGSTTETDPQFHQSIAYGITAADTTYWNHKLNGGH